MHYDDAIRGKRKTVCADLVALSCRRVSIDSPRLAALIQSRITPFRSRKTVAELSDERRVKSRAARAKTGRLRYELFLPEEVTAVSRAATVGRSTSDSPPVGCELRCP